MTLAAWDSWKVVPEPGAFAAHFAQRAEEFEAAMRASCDDPAALEAFLVPTRGGSRS